MEQCGETWAYKIQTPGNYPEESIQYNGVLVRTTPEKVLQPIVRKFCANLICVKNFVQRGAGGEYTIFIFSWSFFKFSYKIDYKS